MEEDCELRFVTTGDPIGHATYKRSMCLLLVIAAKNPDPEEIKYEMSDLLYHAMVLMVERGVTWEDITAELANR